MKFFNGRDDVDYPDNPDKLREKIISDAISGPQKKPLSFINAHFAEGGGRVHPLLEDLLILANEIEEKWDAAKKGANLVAGSIKFHVDKLESNSVMAGASGGSFSFKAT